MLTYKKLAKKPRSFQSFTGISLEQFDFLSSEIEKKYKITEKKRLSSRKRRRRVGAGRKFELPIKDRVVMLLVTTGCTSPTIAGYLFCLEQSNICRDIKYLEAAVRGSVPIPQMHANSKKLGTIQELELPIT